MSDLVKTLESLRAWIRGAGTEYEPTPPPQADADDALREALRRLRKLDERHQPRYYDTVGGGRSIECAGCKRTPPCPDRRVLDGEEHGDLPKNRRYGG